MADNVTLPGTGAIIAADDISSVFYQRIKIVTAEDASADPIGDLDHGAVRSLFVSPRPDTVMITTPQNSSGLTTASTAYSAGDVMGSGWTVANAAKASGGTGRIVAISLSDYSDIVTSVTFYFAQGSVTFGTDNAAPSISDADSLKLIGSQFVSLNDLGGVRFGNVASINQPYVLDGTDLYVYVVTNVAHTFFGAATDLKLRVSLLRD